jgi:hypothetical protein
MILADRCCEDHLRSKVLSLVDFSVVYEGTMELSSRYTPHKQLLKRQTASSETFKHCR